MSGSQPLQQPVAPQRCPPVACPPAAVFRSAFAEDLDELGERKMAEEGGFRELRLQRLA